MKLKKLIFAVGVLITAVCIFKTSAFAISGAEWDKFYELGDKYGYEVAYDQVFCEDKGYPTSYGTGGVDGINQYGYRNLDKTNGKTLYVGYTAAQVQEALKNKDKGTSSGKTDKNKKHTHSWDNFVVTKEPTCLQRGLLTYTCSCGETKTEEINMVDHTYSIVITQDATCNSYKATTYKCAVCRDSFTVEDKESGYGQHIYIDWVDGSIEPTCTELGKVHYICNVCGDEYWEDVEAKGHNWGNPRVDREPSCKEEGQTSVYCKECGIVKEGSVTVIGKKNHVPSQQTVITETSFWTDGKAVVGCIECGDVLEEVILPATGGDFRYLILAGGAVVVLGFIVIVLISKKGRR